MGQKNYINNLFKRPLWLLMAMCCVVFSSATKKLLELRFDKKVNPQYAASQLVNKKIKDGCRDKRQYLKAKIQFTKQLAPDTDGQGLYLAPGIGSYTFIHSFERYGSEAGFKELQPLFVGITPLYIRHHRLQV